MLQYTFIIFISFFLCSSVNASTDNETLLQLHVIFRHGDRTPDLNSLYPNDPHLNDTYYPEGYGALTKKGQLQEYLIGKALRKQYDKFLGKVYTPEVLDAWSTDFNRTKMSLELVLAGLWPPLPSQMWNALLPWLPVPYNYLPAKIDTLLAYPSDYCDTYTEESNRVEELSEFKDFMLNNNDLIQYINDNSGLNITKIYDLYSLYFGFFAEEQNGRELPEWTNKIYPEFMETGAILFYKVQTYTNDMKHSVGGKMIQKVINNAMLKDSGELEPKGRKLFLYSAHEFNIAHILIALNVFSPHVPPYASYITIEYHQIEHVKGFKIFYQDYIQDEPRLMIIPGCDTFCPFNKFIDLLYDVISVEGMCVK